MLKAIRQVLGRSKAIEVSSDYQAWRDVVFNARVDVPSNRPDQVYGVIMDIGLAADDGTPVDTNLVISETAFASGEASLKTSFGGGVIGLGAKPEISEQAKQIVKLAQPLIAVTEPADNRDLPVSGKVHFYFLTTSGVRFYGCSFKEINAQGHPFNEIFARFTMIKGKADETMRMYSKQ